MCVVGDGMFGVHGFYMCLVGDGMFGLYVVYMCSG